MRPYEGLVCCEVRLNGYENIKRIRENSAFYSDYFIVRSHRVVKDV